LFYIAQCKTPALSVKRKRRQRRLLLKYLTLGYNESMSTVRGAASLMGRRSVEVRIKRWGKREFIAKMRDWGKLGGRPKGSGTKKRLKRGGK
jgi:hypothetical protein